MPKIATPTQENQVADLISLLKKHYRGDSKKMIRRGAGTAAGTSVATSLLGGKALVTVKGLVMLRISEVGRETLSIVSEMQSRENPVELVPRLRAPAELTAEEAIEFRRIVDCMPADWFNAGNLALLTQYARHVITARRIAEAVDAAMKEARGEGLDDLLRAQARETRMILQTMTALRLTPRAVEPRSVSVKKLAQAPSPWAGWKREQHR